MGRGRSQHFLHDQGKRNREAEMRHESADDHNRVVIVRVIRGGDHDRHVHRDPREHRVEQGHEGRFVAAPAEVRPDHGEQDTPADREDKVDAGADHIRPHPDRFLESLAENQPRGIARDAGERHQMLCADPDEGFVDPDDHRSRQATGDAGANDRVKVRPGRFRRRHAVVELAAARAEIAAH